MEVRARTRSRKSYRTASLAFPSGASSRAVVTGHPPEVTVKLNMVVLFSGLPVTVIGTVPVGVEELVEIGGDDQLGRAGRH